MPLPIICFDMDGTLLDEQGCIHPNDAALLGSPEPRAAFIPCTGRPTASVRFAFARAGLFRGRPIPFHMLLQNGALLMARGERELAFRAFAPGVQQDLLALAQRFPAVTFLFLSSTSIYVLWPHPFGVALAGSFGFTLRPLAQAGSDVAFGKVMCMSDSPAALDALRAAIASWPVESARSMPPLLEITNRGVDKGSGITALLEHAGLSGQPFYAAGDGENDLPLFRLAAASFAPSTAPDRIRSAASQVIDVSRSGLLAPVLDVVSSVAS
jgi:hydroxymethylpyrimidine pyrophosphatase-like HAD family hydrolase